MTSKLMTARARLEAFKAGEWPYCQRPPAPSEADSALLSRVVTRSYALRPWRNRHGQRIPHGRACSLLWRAAISLPSVYGQPRPGTSDSVREAIRIAREAYRADKRRPLATLLVAIDQAGCAPIDAVVAILAMRGAQSA